MAKLKYTPQEFIAASFAPMVAVASTSTVENICRKNSLTFIELLAPFCKLTSEVQLKDPNGGISPMKNFRMQLVDINARPPQPVLARKFLNSSVTIPSENVKMTVITSDTNTVDIPTFIPWFDQWRETFLQVQFPSDHEFTRHYLACMFVISSSEQNPLESLNILMQHLGTLQSSSHAKVPKWFSSTVLKFIVLVHDTIEGNNDVAVQTYETLKQTYTSNNCYFLPINSRSPDETPLYLPDPWAQFLTRRGANRSENSSARSSPKTPTDTSVGSMPSSVSSQSGSTPPMNRSTAKLEIGQEANEITSSVQYHPLSPENETRRMSQEDTDTVPPLNNNVWRGSPSISFVHGLHGCCLTMDDIESLKELIHDFSTRALIPYVERQIQTIHDHISNKKGVSRSLFSATKRWFTPNKASSAGAATAFNAVVYANDSTEVQLRRLGDLYFMFGNYSMAFQAYHTVKRDFMADQAWLYYSGAVEMAGLAAFMGGELNRKAMEYLEESITTYLNICKMPQFATRATLFSAECLKAKKMFGEAANQFIRMTSEDSDLRSALLLEQAAYCFLNCVRPRMLRKYAFHIVLSGHRYSKCSQRKHSLRCYRQAFQVYHDKNWSLAEDHIHYTIGRQASSLQLLDEATNSFAKLITATSRQTAHQQAVFLKEYLYAHQSLINERRATQETVQPLPILPIPLIEPEEIKVLLGPQQPLRTPGRVPASGMTFHSNFNDPIYQKWNKLEELMAQEMSNAPTIFKPQVTYFTSKNIGTVKPIAIIGEPIQVAVALRNTLQIPLPVKELYLLWTFRGVEDGMDFTLSNETADVKVTDKYIRTQVVPYSGIASTGVEEVILNVTPLVIGELVLEGIGYTLVNTIPTESVGLYSVAGKQLFKIKGERLKTKEKDGQPQYAPDKKLTVVIAPSAPCMQVAFSEITQELLANEIQNITVDIRNCGSTPLCHIMMASTVPQVFSLAKPSVPLRNLDGSDRTGCKAYAIPVVLPSQYNNKLEPGQSHSLNLWIRAPEIKGIASLDLLFYYENIDPSSIPRYRLVRHQWHLAIQDSLDVEIQAQPSFGRNLVETIVLSITTLNNNQHHHAVISEITLDHTSLISKNWNLQGKRLNRRIVNLHSQEKVHHFVRMNRIVNEKVEPKHSTIIFQPRQRKASAEVESACLDFSQRAFLPEPTLFATPAELSNPPSISEALLIMGWHATITDSAGRKRNAVGQHHILFKNVTSMFSINKESASFVQNKKIDSIIQKTVPRADVNNLSLLQKQITYNLIHASHLDHNFSSGFICIAPVLIIINSTIRTPTVVKVNTLGTSNDKEVSTSRYELANPQSQSNFRWIGQCEFVANLPPYTSIKLCLQCAFVAPGTYDLAGRIEVLCRSSKMQFNDVMQNVSYDSTIIVNAVHSDI